MTRYSSLSRSAEGQFQQDWASEAGWKKAINKDLKGKKPIIEWSVLVDIKIGNLVSTYKKNTGFIKVFYRVA